LQHVHPQVDGHGPRDDAGRPCGEWEFRDRDGGAVLARGGFDDGLPVGTWSYCDTDGVRVSDIHYEADARTITRYAPGTTRVVETQRRVGDDDHGIQETFWPDGAVCVRTDLRPEQGRYQRESWGMQAVYDAAGRLVADGCYGGTGSDRRGAWRFWYPNGQLAAEGEFSPDASWQDAFVHTWRHATGPWTYHHPNGQLAAAGTYPAGEWGSGMDIDPPGWTFHDHDGRPMTSERFWAAYGDQFGGQDAERFVDDVDTAWHATHDRINSYIEIVVAAAIQEIATVPWSIRP
jgi:hypothetical protein